MKDNQLGVQNKIKDSALIILVFFVIYYIFYLLESPFHTFIASFITLQSEYTIGEQLSKFYLFTTLLVSFFSYRILTKSTEIKLSISFLLFSIILYTSESNMVRETAQPIFGIIGIAFSAYFLFRLRLWLSLILFFSAFVFFSFGSLIDFIHERESIKELLPSFIYPLLDLASEERFDVIGALFFCLSSVIAFQVPVLSFIANHTKKTLFILLSALVISVGNGFLHYQYEPSGTLYLVAIVMTIIGFSGLIFSSKNIYKDYPKLTSTPDSLFYISIFLCFVVLPSNHTLASIAFNKSLLIWSPIIILISLYMWYSHNKIRD